MIEELRSQTAGTTDYGPAPAPPRRLVLLGPQRLQPTVGAVIRGLRVAGAVALVTAGWRERETEDGELRAAIGRPADNLRLGERTRSLLEADAELAAVLRRRQDRLKEAQRLYRLQLGHALEAARELCRPVGEGYRDLRREAAEAAVEALRVIDREHLRRVAAIRLEADDEIRPDSREPLVRARAEVAAGVGESRVVVVAGGHVAVLLNRLRLLVPASSLAGRWVVAWSAGAMALGGRILLFHDSPPQGAGNAELLDVGLGLFDRLVVLPHARRRLRLDDRERVGLLAARIAPAPCVTLDDGARLDWRAERGWRAWPGVRRLAEDGRLDAPGAL